MVSGYSKMIKALRGDTVERTVEQLLTGRIIEYVKAIENGFHIRIRHRSMRNKVGTKSAPIIGACHCRVIEYSIRHGLAVKKDSVRS